MKPETRQERWGQAAMALAILAGCLEWSPPTLVASLPSSDWSPSEKPGDGGCCDLSQLSGKVQQHYHGYPSQHLQAVVFG